MEGAVRREEKEEGMRTRIMLRPAICVCGSRSMHCHQIWCSRRNYSNIFDSMISFIINIDNRNMNKSVNRRIKNLNCLELGCFKHKRGTFFLIIDTRL